MNAEQKEVLNSLNPACLKKAEEWEPPTCKEVRAVIGLIGLSGSQIAKRLGVTSKSIRNWQSLKESSVTSSIPYGAWAMLCYFAGFGIIFAD